MNFLGGYVKSASPSFLIKSLTQLQEAETIFKERQGLFIPFAT